MQLRKGERSIICIKMYIFCFVGINQVSPAYVRNNYLQINFSFLSLFYYGLAIHIKSFQSRHIRINHLKTDRNYKISLHLTSTICSCMDVFVSFSSGRCLVFKNKKYYISSETRSLSEAMVCTNK